MKRSAWWSVVLLISLSHPARGQTLGTNFTYQGQIKQSGAPLNNTADFEFKLFNAPSGGAQVGSTNPLNNINVVNGLFTVSLNFGSGAFNGDQRWLEVRARSPAGGGNFTTLTPRQPLTSTPYALYALTGPGSGGPWAVNGNNVFNTNTGNVGIGTTSPQAKLHLVTTGEGVRIQGPANGSVNTAWMGFDNGAGTRIGYVGDGSTGDNDIYLTADAGNVYLYTAIGAALTARPNGNVGIGTTSPVAKLDVRGDIQLGDSGELLAAGGEENLRIIRGVIAANGTILEGAGFGVSHPEAGRYIVTFDTPFADVPTITGTADRDPTFFNGVWCVMTDLVTASGSELLTGHRSSDPPWQDRTFQFIAIGPR